MASLSRGISFRRQGSSGMSWTDTWSFNEEGVLVRTMKDQDQQLHLQQRFAGSCLSRIHDSQDDDDDADADLHDADASAAASVLNIDAHEGTHQLAAKPSLPSTSFHTCPPSNSSSSTTTLQRSKSVGSSHVPPRKPSPSVFKWIKKALHKMKK